MANKLTPLLQAGVVIVGVRVLHSLNLPTVSVGQLLDALDVTRSRAYELASAIEATLPDLHRPVGRPPIDNTMAREDDTDFLVACRVRDFLMDHPGAAVSGCRNWYSDAFRGFVLDLLAPDGEAHGMRTADAAAAIGIPEDTLLQWLREPRPTQPSEPNSPKPPPGNGVLEQVLALWERWTGSATAFKDALREQHRIDLSWHTLRSLLQMTGHRQPKKRRKKDAEAIRGALERFFPGAQLMADGKHLVVELDGVSYALNWELAVDADTGAHVGFQVSASEDGQAVIDAVDMAIETIKQPPIALLVDNKPSNHSDDVELAMHERDIMLMPSTPFRPENKATVEGAFGLFSQTMPNISLSSHSPEDLVQHVLFFVLWAYCAGRNQAPQRARRGKSATQLFDDADVSEEDRLQAKRRLAEIKERILKRRDADRRWEDPVVRLMMQREFVTLGLADPEGRFVAALARLGLDPALEAIAIFKAKLQTATLHTDFPERYLLGIAHNVAQRNEDLAVYYELLRLRTEAHDLLLRPLLKQLDDLRPPPGTLDHLKAVAHMLRDATAIVQRRFWMAQLLDAFGALIPDDRLLHGPWLARRVASMFALPRPDRDSIIAAIAQATVA